MQDKDLELEQLLKSLREKKSREASLSEEISEEEKKLCEQRALTAQHKAQLERQRRLEEEKRAAAPEPFPKRAAENEKPAASENSAENEKPDGGIYELQSEQPDPDRKPSRSLKTLLNEPGPQTAEKGMIPPTIERGFDSLELPQVAAPSLQEVAAPKADPSEHPIFNTPNTSELPELAAKKRRAVRAADSQQVEAPQPIDNGLRLDEEALSRQRDGVINVKEKVDDEFREFFGDTVIIDREPLDTKQLRQRKITGFVMSGENGAEGGPVFEDDTEQDSNVIDEYRSEEDTEPILSELMRRKGNAVFKLVLTSLIAASVVALNLALVFGLDVAEQLAQSSTVFYGICAAAAFAAVLINIPQVGRGLGGLFSFRCNNDSLYALAAVAMLAEPVGAMLLAEQPAQALVAAPAAAAAMFFAGLGRARFISKVLQNFRAISTGFEKCAAYMPEDETVSRRLSVGLELDQPKILLKRRTGFTDNFLKYAFSTDSASASFTVFGSIMLIVTVICTAITYLKTGDALRTVQAFSLSAVLCSSFAATLKSELPLARMQDSLAKYGTSVPGFQAAEIASEVNTVLLEGSEIFPKGSILLHGIKTFEKERVDRAILYASSVLIPHCSTLSPVFSNVIQGKNDMLYRTDGVEYEDGLGFACWIDKTRVLIGTREMMQAHEIKVPSLDFEVRYTKTRSRDAIYLAVGGELYAMFVVSYSLTTEVEEVLHSFEREGIDIAVRSNDFNITAKKISDIFSVPQAMFTVLRSGESQLAANCCAFSPHSDSLVNHIGSLISYSKGVFACRRLSYALRLTNRLTMVAMSIGAVIALALAVLGDVQGVSAVSLLVFQLFWLAVIWISSKLARY